MKLGDMLGLCNKCLWSNRFDKKPIRQQYLIVQNGELAGVGKHSYSKGSATSGSEEAARYKKK